MEPTAIISGVIGAVFGAMFKQIQRWAASRNMKGIQAYCFGVFIALVPFSLFVFAFAYPEGLSSLNGYYVLFGGLFATFLGVISGWEIIQLVETSEIKAS